MNDWEQGTLDYALGIASEPESAAQYLREATAPRVVWGDYTGQKRQHCGDCEQRGVPVRARRVRAEGKVKTYYCRDCAEPIEAADKTAPRPAAKQRARREVA